MKYVTKDEIKRLFIYIAICFISHITMEIMYELDHIFLGVAAFFLINCIGGVLLGVDSTKSS